MTIPFKYRHYAVLSYSSQPLLRHDRKNYCLDAIAETGGPPCMLVSVPRPKVEFGRKEVINLFSIKQRAAAQQREITNLS